MKALIIITIALIIISFSIYSYYQVENPTIKKTKEYYPIREVFSFVVYGDSGNSDTEVHEELIELIKSKEPDVVIHTGDIVQNCTKSYQFDNYERIVDGLNIYEVIGDNEAECRPNSWGSFIYKNAFFILGDSNVNSPEQDKWLAKQLKKDKWRFVFFHQPIYSSIQEENKYASENWVPILEQGGADIVFNGHDHLYQRTLLISDRGKHYIPYITTGGGGSPIHYQKTPHIFAEKTILDYHFVLVSVGKDQVCVRVIDLKNTLLDSFCLR